jgi:hypothetical protein
MALFETPTATECLYSTIKNTGTVEKFFGFLPPHGRRLYCGEEISVWGDIQHWLTRFTPNDRARRSLEVAIGGELDSSGNTVYDRTLVIVKTPSVHLLDITLDETKIITLDNESLATADPCWGQYSSSSINCDADLGGNP